MQDTQVDSGMQRPDYARLITPEGVEALREGLSEFQFNLQIHSMKGDFSMEHLERDAVDVKFQELRDMLASVKPNDRSSVDRAFAIVITEVEKAYAYYKTFAVWE